MKTFPKLGRIASVITVGLGLWGLAIAQGDKKPAETPSNFSSQTIDIGVVCSDVERSVDFYTQAVGFTEQSGFDVPADFAGNVGLSDHQPFHVHVLTLGKGETATKLKLMEFKKAPGKKSDQSFIHSTIGLSYLTIFVKDIDAANLRMIAYGSMPLGKGLTEIPDGRFLGLYRDPDMNFVELVGPRVKK
jgi:predicted enzyme related to lactoylglutathione lyase